ncbi:MAG: hypothetical protein ACHQT9_02975 [Candidatus Saccharimonadales bacterium]
MIRAEVPPIMDDEQAKNIGTAAGIAVAIPIMIELLKSGQPYNHHQDEISNIQSSLAQLDTAKTLVGNSGAVQPAIQHLDAQIGRDNKAIVGLERHTPNHLSFDGGMAIAFGPPLAIGIAAWVMAYKARKSRAIERGTYKDLAKDLMSYNREKIHVEALKMDTNIDLFRSGVHRDDLIQ